MLRKLLKYDLRELRRTTLPMFISSLIIGAVCCALLFFTYSYTNADGLFSAFTFAISFYGIGIVAIGAMFVVSIFVSISRYYRSLFTDEGYLNMVIPVKTSTLLNSKILAVAIWGLVTVIVSGASIILATVLPTALYDPEYLKDIWYFIQLMFTTAAPSGVVVLSVALYILEATSSAVNAVIVVLSAITIGSMLIKNHKIFGSIIIYIFVSLFQSIMELVITYIVGLSFDTTIYGGAVNTFADEVLTAANILLYAVIAIVMYIINLRIMDKKFNIE